MVGRRPQHAVSKLACPVLSSVISCRSSICPGRLSTAWLVSLVVFSCHVLQVVTRDFHRSSLRGLICPAQDYFIFHSVDYIYEFCPLPDPDVDLSILVCDVEHTSFHFGLCGRKFVLCLFCQCPGLCTICHSLQHTGVVHLSLQVDCRWLGRFLKISRCLAYAAQPAMILRCISLSWLFSLRLYCCPKYT